MQRMLMITANQLTVDEVVFVRDMNAHDNNSEELSVYIPQVSLPTNITSARARERRYRRNGIELQHLKASKAHCCRTICSVQKDFSKLEFALKRHEFLF